MKPTNRNRRLRKAIGWTAFLSLAIVLQATVNYFAMSRRSARHEIVTLESTRDALQVLVDRWETGENQAASDKQIVSNVLRHCRAAEDIPDLRGNRIVARRQGFGTLCLYVPEGSHRLVISSTWKPASTLDPAKVDAADDAADEAGAGEKTWSVPLIASCGYFLQLDIDRQGGRIQWELTSNHPNFKARSETVLLEGFSHRGSSWSGSDVMQFPNQISFDEWKGLGEAHLGVKLMNAKLSGLLDDRQYEVRFLVRLSSDGPSCVSASEALGIIVLGREDLLLPYQGDGKYEVRSREKKPPHESGQ